jgi:hypothetical protein
MRLVSIFKIIRLSESNFSSSAQEIYHNRLQIIICVSISIADPFAI